MRTTSGTGRFNTIASGLSGLAMVVMPAHAGAPDKGSEQWIMMQDYVDFVRNMRTIDDRSCCDVSDGRANMQEKPLFGDDKAAYRVFVTRKEYKGYDTFIPPEGRWVDVPRQNVLTADHARQVCDAMVAANPKLTTCKAPPFNILWMSASGTVYCYWPLPQAAENQPARPYPTQVIRLAMH